MNMQEPSWFAELRISGSNQPERFEGTPQDIMMQIIQTMMRVSPRQLADGKELNFTMRSTAFATNTKSELDRKKLVREIEAELPPVNPDNSPQSGENFEQYYDRLLSLGIGHYSAGYIARDWFNLPPDESLAQWLSDPKAQRFRELNTSNKAFESALPSEYAELKAYVLANYCEFVAGVLFRTA